MPATTMGPGQSAGAAPADGKRQAPTIMVPFTRVAREHQEPMIDVTQPLGVSSVALGPWDVPAYGYVRGLWITIEALNGSGVATVATKEDAPWSAINEIALLDVNGAPLFGPVSGYDLYLATKYGGYGWSPDPKLSPVYSAPAVGANGSGNFKYMLYLPVEISARDALGALPNANAASTYKLRVTVAPGSEVYSTAPTNLPQLRIRVHLDAWAQPSPTDLRGNTAAQTPPAMGTTQYWSKTTLNLASGYSTNRLPRVGSYIRNLLFIMRDGAGSRTTGAGYFPADPQIYWDSKLLTNISSDLWRHLMQRRTGYTAAVETPGGLDRGVYMLDFMHEFDGHLGAELRDGWLPTVQSTRLELNGTFTGAGVLSVMTNDVAPAGNIFVE